MSMSLEEALGAVDLQPGQTYRCRVKGRDVEVSVSAIDESRLAPEMLDITVKDDAPRHRVTKIRQGGAREPSPFPADLDEAPE
ncbi:MAG: hypothetical protein ACRC33_19010 [Gemmataceae bacterium]